MLMPRAWEPPKPASTGRPLLQVPQPRKHKETSWPLRGGRSGAGTGPAARPTSGTKRSGPAPSSSRSSRLAPAVPLPPPSRSPLVRPTRTLPRQRPTQALARPQEPPGAIAFRALSTAPGRGAPSSQSRAPAAAREQKSVHLLAPSCRGGAAQG